MQKRTHTELYLPEGSDAKKMCTETTNLRFLVKTTNAGGIIGKGGQTIKSLRENYNVTVNVPDTNAEERVLTINGAREDCIAVLMECLDEMKDPPYSQHTGVSVGMYEIDLIVQASQAGGVIGPKGARINEVRERCACQLRMFPDRLSGSNERVIAIGGERENIGMCLELLLYLLDQSPAEGTPKLYDPSVSTGMDEFAGGKPRNDGARNRQRGGGMGMGRGGMRGGGPRVGGPRVGGQFSTPLERFFQAPMPWAGYGPGFAGDPFRPYAPPMGPQGPYRPPGPPGPAFGGFMAGAGYEGNLTRPPAPVAKATGRAPNLMDSAGPPNASPIQTIQVTITEDMVGAIIGRGGERINSTRGMSGADVKVDGVNGEKERTVTITGLPAQCEHAQFLMQENVRRFSKSAS